MDCHGFGGKKISLEQRWRIPDGLVDDKRARILSKARTILSRSRLAALAWLNGSWSIHHWVGLIMQLVELAVGLPQGLGGG